MDRIIGLVLVAAVLTACGVTEPESGQLADLARNARLWEETRPPSYTYALELLCFCGVRGPVRVRVEGATVTERVFVDTGLAVSPDLADQFPDVDGMFGVLRAALEDDAHSVTVTYDPASGVPVDFFIDYQEFVADEELGMRVTESVEPI